MKSIFSVNQSWNNEMATSMNRNEEWRNENPGKSLTMRSETTKEPTVARIGINMLAKNRIVSALSL